MLLLIPFSMCFSALVCSQANRKYFWNQRARRKLKIAVFPVAERIKVRGHKLERKSKAPGRTQNCPVSRAKPYCSSCCGPAQKATQPSFHPVWGTVLYCLRVTGKASPSWASISSRHFRPPDSGTAPTIRTYLTTKKIVPLWSFQNYQ